MKPRIFLSLPHLGGSEMKWIEEAFKDNWVVPLGPNVNEFERLLGDYLGNHNIAALSAGTAAIHLGLVALDVKEGEEVICQSFTFAASANPIKYLGAKPVFIDSEPDTWNMCPIALEEAIIDRKRITGKYPKAIIPVHLYGMPAKMNEILAIADKYGIPVLEDAAEALGSEYCGKLCGTLGKYGALSFNGNKIITTSGGGALICPTEEADKHIKFLATQARETKPYYYHNVIGYNYRLSNISAGIGCGQMQVLEQHVERRKAIHSLYTELLKDIKGVYVKQNHSDDFDSNFWLTTITFDDSLGISPEDIRQALEEENIETRWLWRPMHMQPTFKDAPYYGGDCAEKLFNHGLCLPSGSCLSDDDIRRVSCALISFFKNKDNTPKKAVKDILVAFDLDDTLYKEEDFIKSGYNITLDKYTIRTLESLKGLGYHLALITDGEAKVQREKIKALGLDKFIDTLDIIISQEIGTEKTERQNFQYFADKYPDYKKFYYIGDNTAKDFYHPNRMKWTTICIADNGRNKHKQNFNISADYLPDYIVDNFSDILEFIEE